MSKLTITLDHPISVNGETLDELSLRRPKVRDMLSVEHSSKNDAEKEIHLFANLCELSPDEIMDLDMADYTKFQKAYQDFLSSSQQMPAAPS